MDVLVRPSERIGVAGADVVGAALAAARRPDATVMPALGTSALPVYRDLALMSRSGGIDTRALRLIQLDEYAGIAADDPRTLLGWLRRDVAEPLGIPDARIIGFDGVHDDPEAAVRRYDEAVAAAGAIDVAVLGLGPNGHLGFNEPPSPRTAPTRLVRLSAASVASNARYWPDRDVPTTAVTAGMPTILGARRVLLVVTGATKRTILERTIRGPITPDVPASFLQEHDHVTVLADPDAWPHGADA